MGTRPGDHPFAENYYSRALTLPLFPRMGEEDLERVVRVLRELLSGVGRKEPVWNSNR